MGRKILLDVDTGNDDAILLAALVKHIVGESENRSNDVFECFLPRFAEDLLSKLERSEIHCQFVF